MTGRRTVGRASVPHPGRTAQAQAAAFEMWQSRLALVVQHNADPEATYRVSAKHQRWWQQQMDGAA